MLRTPISAVVALFLFAFEASGAPRLADMPVGEASTRFTVVSGDNSIAAEIHRLPGTTPKTAVIVVGGSGARTRADTAPAIPLLLDGNTAVITYDRRGNGDSTGSYERPNTANTAWLVPLFAGDVADVAGYLKQEGFARVGLIGTSMGGWVNVAAAARTSAIGFVICMNGGASSVGVSDEFDHLTDEGMSIEEATALARAYEGEAGYDPANDLVKLAQPMLWIFGAEDDSNPTRLDSEIVEALRAKGKPFAIITLADTNHDLINLKTNAFNTDWVDPVRRFISGE
jgi:pimeloyl-ACP methyl ester carboxylesterase